MAIPMFMQARVNLTMLERDVEKMINDAILVRNENEQLRKDNTNLMDLIDKLNNELNKLKENGTRENDNSSSLRNDNEN